MIGSILTSGITISQRLLMFKHVSLCSISMRTYFYQQKNLLFPAVLTHWERYQSTLIEKVKLAMDVQWSGHSHFYSMGHSAKYGSYTMFCNTISKIVHLKKSR